jgi:hypothetical protein
MAGTYILLCQRLFSYRLHHRYTHSKERIGSIKTPCKRAAQLYH